MFKYVQVDNNGNVWGTLETPREIPNSPNLIRDDNPESKIGKKLVDGSFVDVVVPVNLGTVISKKAFILRFTENEWTELEVASQHESGKTKAQNINAAKIRRAKLLMESVNKVDLTDASTIELVTSMCGILQVLGVVQDGSVRASEILDTSSITKDELP